MNCPKYVYPAETGALLEGASDSSTSIGFSMKAQGKTVRSFGERGLNTYTPSTANWTDFYNDYVNGTSKVKVTPRAEIMGLRDVYAPLVAAADSGVPDVVRAQGFLQEFNAFDKNDNLPQLCILLLY